MKPTVAALCAILFIAGIIELSASGREICKCKRIATPHLKSVHPKPKLRPATTPQATASFSGRATLLFLTNTHEVTQAPVIIGDTGLLGSAGGLRNVSVTSTSIVDVLQLSMGTATTIGAGAETRSEATLQNFSTTLVTVGQGTHVLAFSLLQAVAEAECTTNGVVLTANTQIEGLTLNGVAVNVTGEANQLVQFPGGTLTINAQTNVQAAKSGSITVAGLVVMLDGCDTIYLGLVNAGIRCQGRNGKPPKGDCSDRVTGGGFIFGTPSSARANFGVGGGRHNGRLWGHLNFIDHDTGMHVKATGVTGYTVVDAHTRMITYNVKIDGAVGTASVVCTDAGEPGRDDLFMIELSNGYTAGGDLGGSGSGGGNLQLHKPKCR